MGAATLYERWAAGVCGIADGEGRCLDFVVTDHLSVKEARRADRFTQLAQVASDEAIADAGWSDGLPYDARAVGSIIGTGIGGIGTIEANDHLLIDQGPKHVSPLAVPLMMGNAAAAAVSMRHGLRGITFGTMSACSSGADAIGPRDARDRLRRRAGDRRRRRRRGRAHAAFPCCLQRPSTQRSRWWVSHGRSTPAATAS